MNKQQLEKYKEEHCEGCGGYKECCDSEGDLEDEQVKICMGENK